MRDYDAIKEALTFYAATAETTRKTRALLDAADAIEELLKENTELDNSGRVLMAAFARLKERVPQWISVEERLPHYLDHVLCINKFGIQMVGYLTDYKEGGFRCESGMDSCNYITHWMPLPEPPKEDAHEG